MEGTVTYVSGKGWFFAKSDDLISIFIHQRDVQHRRYLQVDDRVSFDVVPSTQHPGDFQAANVKYLGHTISRQTSGAVEASNE
jgi:cold shock CspA family protein